MSLNNSLKGNPEAEKLHIPYASVSVIPCRQALVFAPHPDDEVFGCGGAIARHVEQRVPVQVIIVTNGAFTASDSVSDVVAIREAESRAAAEVLGYGEPIFWRLPDRGLEFGEELVERVRGAVVACGADLIYSPSLREVHPDHRVLAMAVTEALRRLGGGLRVAFYEVGIPLAPNLLLDISDLISIKGEAMSCFISQLAIQRYDQHIVALNRYRTYTLSSEVAAAEAFFLVAGSALETSGFGLYEPEFLQQHRVKADLTQLQQTLHSRAAEADQSRQEIVRLQATLQGVYGSRSWRVTAPLRDLTKAVTYHFSRGVRRLKRGLNRYPRLKAVLRKLLQFVR